MASYSFEGHSPKIGSSSYVHEAASVIGNVTIGESCFVGAGAVIRGDYGRIEIGSRTSVQENCVIHARFEDITRVGSDVQLGHAAVLHNCEVKDFAVIGLGSRICDFSSVGRWAIIGEGAVVPTRAVIPDEMVAVGTPAKLLRKVTEEEKKAWGYYKVKYSELAQRYKTGLQKL